MREIQAMLALEDGRVFRGRGFGARGEAAGEVVFNTSLTGYQEIFTDPSYAGQIVVLTNPHIGNYGTSPSDAEAARPYIEGLVTREFSAMSSNWRSTEVADEYLERSGIPVIAEVDTRAVVRHLRMHGVMRGVIASGEALDAEALVAKARAIRKMKAISGCEDFSLLGWCIGAILTTVYAALRADDGLRNLILLTAPLDFSDKKGITFARWVDERYFDVEKVLAAFGNMPGEMIDYGAKALKPVENYITNYCRLWDSLDNPRAVESWHAMNTWVRDILPMAGGAYRQLIVDLYRNNRMMKGELIPPS